MGATVNEYVADGDWASVRRNFEQLTSLVPETGGQSLGVRFGVDTLTFPGGSSLSTIDTVSHGLGKAPVAVFLTARHDNIFVGMQTITATDFTMRGRTVDGSSPAAASPVNYYWLAIG